jgi:hypothetical protein
MAVTVGSDHTAHIDQCRSFMAFLKATKRRHQMSTRFDITQSDMPPIPDFWGIFHRQFNKKGLELTFRPQLNNRGVTHQNDEKH